ncbi:MAG TPA: Asp-tRNA(Asn)/Glu-tRNA(Gln) amidotransferase subunit GatC [Candidatus Aminicenantes bacterium]|nr:Asp-tRNA(Asn)/Glu-tRNA(Gln) amidotransferase subunit GatC [Candidatus Aminicenantes bacterium]
MAPRLARRCDLCSTTESLIIIINFKVGLIKEKPRRFYLNFEANFFIILPPMPEKIDIDYVCSLAALRLSEEEKKELAPQLQRIVEWIAQISSLNLTGIKDKELSTVSLATPLRKDVVQGSLSPEEALANAPEKENELFKVPRVIEGGDSQE